MELQCRWVSWTVFENLPGAADATFEMLCRALVRRHYGRFGDFAARANQPGVEFHLKLHSGIAPSEHRGFGTVGNAAGTISPAGNPLGRLAERRSRRRSQRRKEIFRV